jgi:squalene synthase HpnC
MMTGGPGLLEPERVASRARQENFPVASRLLPRAIRADLMAIYGFARMVDDAGDEADGDRLALLDRIESELDRAYAGTAIDPSMRSLAVTIRAHGLPREPFLRLIEANRTDQVVSRYETFADLLGYCELSANPVGRLVLLVLGAATPRRLAWSDSVCTGLQLVEHWQDVAEDARRGRVYLPQEDLRRFECDPDELLHRTPSPAFRRLLSFEAARARTMLRAGLPLVADLSGRAGFAIAAYVAGGRAALDAIERAGYDVLSRSPRPSRVAQAMALARTLVEALRTRRGV